MKFERRDLTKLQWYALLALVAIAIAVAAGFWSSIGAGKARVERDAAAVRKAQTEQRLSQVRTEEQEIKERTQQYQQMEQAGVTGPGTARAPPPASVEGAARRSPAARAASGVPHVGRDTPG